MTRTIAFLIGCTALISGALPTWAADPGWKVSSYQSVKIPEVCFYGSADIFRANGLLSVWTKCLAKVDLDNAVKEDSTGSLSDLAAEKIAHDYVPPIAGIKALDGDQIVDAVMDEELANNGNIRPLVTVLREIDCAKRRARDLSIIKPVDGEVRSQIRRKTGITFLIQAIWHLFRNFYAQHRPPFAPKRDGLRGLGSAQNTTGVGGTALSSGGISWSGQSWPTRESIPEPADLSRPSLDQLNHALRRTGTGSDQTHLG